MADVYYTIGMAGHIDHGKTTLTKALTGVDTDRLKEEKERHISIEPGYAPLKLENGIHVSIVDVPGHERFIRQMIAGVAGIDLVLLVIAADEGVMPQTKEHLQILKFLGIKKCMVVVSKMDRVEEELLELAAEEIKELLEETDYKNAPILYVDSLSGKGISELKQAIQKEIAKLEQRDSNGSFRLPIDQTFTVQGHGTVVRGTVFEGIVTKDSPLTLLPSGKTIKIRQIQVHNKETEKAQAGQRVALNITGTTKDEIKRGDVLVDSENFHVTRTIDISLQLVSTLAIPLKQRTPVKLHVGTTEAYGKIVFFDRNEVKDSTEEILCQVRLEEEIVVRRGDRFILRRPTPIETLGGGWIIQPQGGKYRFGEETITMLKKQIESSPTEILDEYLRKNQLLSKSQLIQLSSLQEDEVDEIVSNAVHSGNYIEITQHVYSLKRTISKINEMIVNKLLEYHEEFPLRIGMSNAELIQVLGQNKKVIEYCIKDQIESNVIKKEDQYLAVSRFKPSLPNGEMENIVSSLINDGIQPKKWADYIKQGSLSNQEANELKVFLLKTNQALTLNEETLIYKIAFDKAVNELKAGTDASFSLAEAKEILSLSRKYLIPFLELLDQNQYTKRDEVNRVWINK
ncbi:selenocysteine-specific translation elongation factor [Fredinandcohnia sp. QZ13]|uniref:selenocysteine-specific translation elongation factor n=1 Tax=Fredinandcohnia sp. QZ13 TaxID=3073144 RepID=UPI0028534263|nr:selenocysteine-specific translation elongation factor [Fredinandcohnia sp. QZ13]MDR4886324.1 selenocysteine-specific translation elongation factor [Fredinandcohnia sp. QZ13]